uniref:Putative therostasin-like protein n=1 Tax=Haementeria vizottoi TaxID=1628691 RepID=A0A0P4W5M3_9ANNE
MKIKLFFILMVLIVIITSEENEKVEFPSCETTRDCPWNLECNKKTSKCECRNQVCSRGCPDDRYKKDEYGCRKCLCEGCGGIQCRIGCKYGFKTNATGCESVCTCNTKETACVNIWCTKPYECDPNEGRCAIPGQNEDYDYEDD